MKYDDVRRAHGFQLRRNGIDDLNPTFIAHRFYDAPRASDHRRATKGRNTFLRCQNTCTSDTFVTRYLRGERTPRVGIKGCGMSVAKAKGARNAPIQVDPALAGENVPIVICDGVASVEIHGSECRIMYFQFQTVCGVKTAVTVLEMWRPLESCALPIISEMVARKSGAAGSTH